MTKQDNAPGGQPWAAGPETFQRLVDFAFDVALIGDASARFRYVSPAVERVFGYSPGDVVGREAWDFIHPDDHAAAWQLLSETLEHPGRHGVARLRVQDARGSWRLVETAAVNFCNDPAVGGIVVNLRDVTENVGATEALAMSEARLGTLLSHVADIVSVHDADGSVRYVSPSVAAVTGKTPEEVVGALPLAFVRDVDRDRVRAAFAAWLTGSATQECVEFMLQGADGAWRTVESTGVNLVDNPQVGGVVVTTRDITDHKRTEEELARLAVVDTLTGLPNRTLLLDRVQRALVRTRRRRGVAAVLLIDLDDFKAINDAAGHMAGDELLVEVARRLERAVNAGDTVSRWGGDEFVILTEDLDANESAAAVAERVREVLATPVALADAGEVYVTASIGIATGPARDAHTLLAAADAAMYRAKERGRARFEVFDEKLRAAVVERLRLHRELPRALERSEFVLHYQPIVHLITGRVTGVEALIRWDHPERGLLLPGVFMPAAEDSGLIGDIGRWVLRTAASEAASWPAAADGSQLGIAVNLSARQLADPRLADEIERIVADAGLAPARLTLEVTESAVMADPDTAIAILGRLRAIGVRIAVDDFGTGYSSLGYLRRLPCDIVKIDRSFVAGLGRESEDTVIVEAVVGLAHTLGLLVTAEGCEEQAQAVELARLGADDAQGYLWARPAPAADLHAVIGALLDDQPV